VGLIIDSSVLIAGERRGETVKRLMLHVQQAHGNLSTAVSAVSIVELTHGIYRAQTEAHRQRRRIFVEGVCRDMAVYPLTLEIAQLAGRIEGEQVARGIYHRV
jgi:tRNA(fMet)-specific endonuclease VapC